VAAILVALSGPSGAGKSTVAAALARRDRWAKVDEAFDRLVPAPDLRFASQRELRRLELRLLGEEARRFAEARRWVRAGQTVVADTPFLDPVGYTAGLFVLGLASVSTFRAVVQRARGLARDGQLGVPDLTVELCVASTTRLARAARDAARHPAVLRDRHEAVGAVDGAILLPWWQHRFPGRVRMVGAERQVDLVAERVRALASRTAPLRDPCGAGARALEALVRLPALREPLDRSGKVKKGTPSPRPPR